MSAGSQQCERKVGHSRNNWREGEGGAGAGGGHGMPARYNYNIVFVLKEFQGKANDSLKYKQRCVLIPKKLFLGFRGTTSLE